MPREHGQRGDAKQMPRAGLKRADQPLRLESAVFAVFSRFNVHIGKYVKRGVFDAGKVRADRVLTLKAKRVGDWVIA